MSMKNFKNAAEGKRTREFAEDKPRGNGTARATKARHNGNSLCDTDDECILHANLSLLLWLVIVRESEQRCRHKEADAYYK